MGMQAQRDKVSAEPAVAQGAMVAVVAALVTLAVAFGAPVSADQQKAILGLAVVVGPLVAGLRIRSRVVPKRRS